MPTDVRDLYRQALKTFGRRVHGVRDGQWDASTPCPEWDLRMLVNHVVGETLWVEPLLAGALISDVGDRFDGDVLGDDPVAAWDAAAQAAMTAVNAPGAMDRTVHLSFGDFPGSEYIWQMFADLLVHGWDLAQASGQDASLDPDLVAACSTWFSGVADNYRAAGAVGDRPDVPPGADPGVVLLADFGRVAESTH